MTTPELISVYLGDGTTPDEDALLSRELAANPMACRDFVEAARIEGTLQAWGASGEAEARLAASLDVAGVPSSYQEASRSPRQATPFRRLAVMATILAVAGGWWIWRNGTEAPAAGSPDKITHRPAALNSPGTPSQPAAVSDQGRPAVAQHAARFYLSKVAFENLPIDSVIEQLLSAVAEDNHLQRPEFLGFELAWQPLDVASASSPPRITLRQSAVTLATVLEWIAILSDCTVQWHAQGARLVEFLPESTDKAPASRSVVLADLPPPSPADGDTGTSPAPSELSAAEILEGIGLTGEHTRGARWDAATTLMTVDLPETLWARLQKIMALQDRNDVPEVSLTARLFEFGRPQEIVTEVLDPVAYQQLADDSEARPGAASLSVPSVRARAGQPFLIERTHPLSGETDAVQPHWAGLRVSGRADFTGEVIRVSATVHLRLPPGVAGDARPAFAALEQASLDPASLQPFAADLEAYTSSGHTVVFAITEKDADRSLALHLTAETVTPATADPASGARH